MRSALDERVSRKTIRVVPALLPGAVRPEQESKLPRFLRRLTWVNFSAEWREPEVLHRLVCGIKGIMPGRHVTETQTDICPFRGLEVFREQDHCFFFGREAVVQRLLDKLKTSRFLAVLGPSGCGKSSVVQAGLIPYLKEQALVTLFTPRERPIEELAYALRQCYPENKQPRAKSLIDALTKSGKNLHYLSREALQNTGEKNLVFVIDQFEEVFTQTSGEEERSNFISLVLNAVEVLNGPVMVIITMRTDFMGKCAFYPDLNTYVSDYFLQVEPMSFEQLRRAIEEPARLVGLNFERGLVDRILNDVKGAPCELPLLEHAMLELYERRQGTQLTAQAYEDIGGIEGALVKRAESEFAKLDDAQKEILRKMFVLRLIQPGEGTEDTRRRAGKDELLAVGDDSQIAKRLLAQWVNARLLTVNRDSSRQQDLVDVAHEALIRKWDKIQAWMAEGREAARLIGILRQATLEWKRAGCNPDYLFRGARLVQVEALLKTYAEDLTDLEKEFVNEGIGLRERQVKLEKEKREKELQDARDLAAARTKAVNRLVAFILVVLFSLILSVYFLYEVNEKRKIARDKENTIRKQIVSNYWAESRHAKEKGEDLEALYLCAKAVSRNSDRQCHRILMLDMNSYWDRFPLLNIFQHEEAVRGATFNHDGTRILTWSNDKTVRLWDAEGKKNGPVLILKHDGVVWGAIFNHDGKRILTWNSDNTVRQWDANTGINIKPDLEHKDGSVCGATFNQDETRILTWSEDKTARLWDAHTGEQIGQNLKHEGSVWGATFNQDGTRILTWSEDKTARLWESDTGTQSKPKLVFKHKGAVRKATFNQDETQILTWSSEKIARRWDANTGTQIGQDLEFAEIVEMVEGVVFNYNGTRILTWSEDFIAQLWNVDTNIGIPIGPDMKHKGTVRGGSFNRDGTRVLTWSDDKTARLWDVDTGEQIGSDLVHKEEIVGATFNPSETRILTWSSDKTARLWDIDKNIGIQIGPYLVHKELVQGAAFNQDETRVLTWSDDKTLRRWEANTGDEIGQKLVLEATVLGTTFNRDGTRILTWNSDNTARVWSTNTGKKVGPNLKHDRRFLGAIFNRDGTRILTWTAYTTQIWEAKTGKKIKPDLKNDLKNEWVYGATFNQNGTRILTWNWDNTVRRWDASTGKKIKPDLKHEGPVSGATFYQNGTRILTWSSDNTARIWDADTCEQMGPNLVHEGPVCGATLNHDETLILTCSSDKTVRIWDAGTGKQIGPNLVQEGKVRGAIFNNDGTRILTWSLNIVRLLDISVDWDFPKEKIELQIKALTGTTFDFDKKQINFIDSREWRKVKKEYTDAAREHYENCKYRDANVFYKLFLKASARENK
jgi:WD40 repeat protein